MASSDGRLDSIQDIIAKIHAQAAEREINNFPLVFEVYTREDQVRPDYAETCKKWSNAAYVGDWDKLLSIAGEQLFGLGGLANLTRISPSDATGSARRPSGYTALHQAAYNGAPEDVAKALIALGCFRTLRTTDGRSQTPADIASSRGHSGLAAILAPPPDLIPQISAEALDQIQEHFRALVLEEAAGTFKPESMKLLDLSVMREVKKVYMPIPGIYGGFTLTWNDDHLITESYCRVVGGSGRTNFVNIHGSSLVEEGWG